MAQTPERPHPTAITGLFDAITTPTPSDGALAGVSPAGAEVGAPHPAAAPFPPSQAASAYHLTGPSQVPTGLTATVSEDVFLDIVRAAGDVVVLKSEVRVSNAALADQRRGAPRPSGEQTIYRYHVGWAGIVFWAAARQPLTLPRNAREVRCLNVAQDTTPALQPQRGGLGAII